MPLHDTSKIVASLVHDLLRDGALAIERVGGHNGALQRQHLQQFRHCGDLVRLGVSGDSRQHQALLAAPRADHMLGRLAAGPVKRAPQNLPVNGYNPLALRGKLRHELLK